MTKRCEDSNHPFIYHGNQDTDLGHHFSEHIVVNRLGLKMLKAKLEDLDSLGEESKLQEVSFSPTECNTDFYGVIVTSLAPKIESPKPTLKKRIYELCGCGYVLIWTIIFLGLGGLGVVKLCELVCQIME